MLFLLLACALPDGDDERDDCEVEASIADFEPECETALLLRYTGESRLQLPGNGGTLTAFLPEDVQPIEYGGESGQWLHVVLDLGSTELVAVPEQTTLRVAELRDSEADFFLQVVFEGGAVEGPLTAGISWE
jgi:hypothetical protein